jgi:hypothetical protein
VSCRIIISSTCLHDLVMCLFSTMYVCCEVRALAWSFVADRCRRWNFYLGSILPNWNIYFHVGNSEGSCEHSSVCRRYTLRFRFILTSCLEIVNGQTSHDGFYYCKPYVNTWTLQHTCISVFTPCSLLYWQIWPVYQVPVARYSIPTLNFMGGEIRSLCSAWLCLLQGWSTVHGIFC